MEIKADIKTFVDNIENNDNFLRAQLNNVRNEIMKMSLYRFPLL